MTFGCLRIGTIFQFNNSQTTYRKVSDQLYTYDTDTQAVWTYDGLPYWKVKDVK